MTEQQSPQAARGRQLASLPALEQRSSQAANRRAKSIGLKKGMMTSAFKDGATLEYEHFRTTNQQYHDKLEAQDFTDVKRNFKKKTPFTQWSNAYFSGGVFFNPPSCGI